MIADLANCITSSPLIGSFINAFNVNNAAHYLVDRTVIGVLSGVVSAGGGGVTAQRRASSYISGRIFCNTISGLNGIRPDLRQLDKIVDFSKVFARIESIACRNSILLKSVQPIRVAASTALR